MTALKYVPIALYTFGCCWHGHYGKPYKTVQVEADSMRSAKGKAFVKLNPSTIESICHVKTEPNPRYAVWQQDYLARI